MRTIRTKIYKFEELTPEAQDKAISQLYDINVDYDWWTSIYEDAAEIGLKIKGFDLDRNRGAQGEFSIAANEVAQNIFNNHGEGCETYKTAQNFMEQWQPVFNDYMNEDSENYESLEQSEILQELEEDFLKDLLEDYSIMLQNDYEYLQSEEAIKETILSNEYEFTQDGRKF